MPGEPQLLGASVLRCSEVSAVVGQPGQYVQEAGYRELVACLALHHQGLGRTLPGGVEIAEPRCDIRLGGEGRRREAQVRRLAKTGGSLRVALASSCEIPLERQDVAQADESLSLHGRVAHVLAQLKGVFQLLSGSRQLALGA